MGVKTAYDQDANYLAFFRSGKNTFEIAQLYRVSEPEVVKTIDRARNAEKRRAA